jgi:hypothetical protein
MYIGNAFKYQNEAGAVTDNVVAYGIKGFRLSRNPA